MTLFAIFGPLTDTFGDSRTPAERVRNVKQTGSRLLQQHGRRVPCTYYLRIGRLSEGRAGTHRFEKAHYWSNVPEPTYLEP
jgi:hypothetical protein